ncbi:MAG TPA: pilus assembly protein PilP [Candidatus Acidoferrum sp.]
MSAAKTLVIALLLAVASQGVQAQTKPTTATDAKSTPTAAAKTTPAAPKAAAPTAKSVATNAAAKTPASAPKTAAASQSAPAMTVKPQAAKTPKTTKPAATPAAKPAAKTDAKPAVKKAPKPPVEGAQAPAEGEAKVSRRDPFESLVSRQQAAAAAQKSLPPGKAGLQVSTLRLDGIVQAPNGMIAVVSNPQARTYFLREGDQLYDGRVEKIAMDGVAFHEIGKDAFGKPVERQVNKKIYSSAGEQQ